MNESNQGYDISDVMSQSVPPFHHQLEILKLQDVHILQTVSFVYNCVRDLGSDHLTLTFKRILQFITITLNKHPGRIYFYPEEIQIILA